MRGGERTVVNFIAELQYMNAELPKAQHIEMSMCMWDRDETVYTDQLCPKAEFCGSVVHMDTQTVK